MPHLDFNYSGLGEAYRVFSQKHARLLSVREAVEYPLAKHIRQMEENLRVHRAAAGTEETGTSWPGLVHARPARIDILHLYDQDREWNRRVLRTVLEMELGYLVAMTDAFLGRWREENGLPAGRNVESNVWHPATEKAFNGTLADLHAKHADLPLRVLRPDTAQRLTEIRERRNAVMHRDSQGVDDITDADVDAAVLTLNSIARALAFVTHAPVAHDRGGRERQRFIAEALET